MQRKRLALCSSLFALGLMLTLTGCTKNILVGQPASQPQYNNPALEAVDIQVCEKGEVLTSERESDAVQLTQLSTGAFYQNNMDLLPLSPGDFVEVKVWGDDIFSGKFIIDNSGRLSLPYLPPVKAFGKNTRQIEQILAMHLVSEGFFRKEHLQVDVALIRLAPIAVRVSGAVFLPGSVKVNQIAEENQHKLLSGDFNHKRLLSVALRNAGGIRPDANIKSIVLIRDGWQKRIDLSGVFNGNQLLDLPLIAGDRVVVPSRGCFAEQQVRPSEITIPGMRVFMSNLTRPAMHNSASAIGSDATRLPYGTRFLDALVSANCIGGTLNTNAERRFLLMTKDPMTKQTQLRERTFTQLLRGQADLTINPYMMPNDALACFDSDIIELRDFATSVSDVLSPFHLLNMITSPVRGY